VPVRDARPLIGRLSFDKEGFVLLQHQTPAKRVHVHLPTTDGRELVLTRYTELEPELSLLLKKLKLELPANHRPKSPPPRPRHPPRAVPTFGCLPQQSQTLRSLNVLESTKLG
jgi:hypothetical protein